MTFKQKTNRKIKQILVAILICVVLLNNTTPISGMVLQEGNAYEISNTVKYRIETNFTLSHYNKNPYLYTFRNVILNYQENNPQLTKPLIPYQKSLLSYSWAEDTTINQWIDTDKFGNGFYNMEINLSKGDTVTLCEVYELELNHIEFVDENDFLPREYDFNDNIHALYCNSNDPFYQGSEPELINLSNNIAGNESNPIFIAKKILTWISENIIYGVTSIYNNDGAYGALETYHTKKGVCRDFAELMVTLLRIQKIPARIVKGFVLKDYEPHKGMVFNYHSYWKNESFGGQYLAYHSWVEYYAPNFGWLPCDPTWSDTGINYFNSLDCIHFRVASGSWFSMSMYSFSEDYDISIIPLKAVPLNTCTYDFNIEITVINSSFKSYQIHV